ncbi:MAG: F0F1 ATP synthase subunit alpha, partial [Gammaproteobacteria bacterium]|nr:F0F1 ATP synthase subunit alpha [Gammaproteobacteria bacterium]
LEHGERINELMKQKQYAPMTVSEMGVVLFAANERFLEDVPVDKVLDFEGALLSYMHAEHGDFMAQVDREGAYNDEVVATMRSAVEAFKKTQTY